MGQLYWNYERPVRAYAGVAFEAGVAAVIGNTQGNFDVPVMVLPEAGANVDAVAVFGGAVDELQDFADELNKRIPIKVGAAGVTVGLELAVNAEGLFVPATDGTFVVAKALQPGTVIGQVITGQRVPPYAYGGAEPTTYELTPATASITVGGTAQFELSPTPPAGVVWTITPSNGVASVDENGLVTGLEAGETELHALGQTATITVTEEG